MENDQNKLGCKLSITDLNDLEYALEFTELMENRASDELQIRLGHLRKLFHQLRAEGERGGYDEWIIQEILS